MNEELLASLDREVLGWPGVRKETFAGGPGRGGFWVPPFTSYRFGRRELGHVHDTGVADLPFPRAIHDQLATIPPRSAVVSRLIIPGIFDVPRVRNIYSLP